uniref:Uncharacterized protein n=1 Tax=viral metagenome TaxID=1070528 RepID=A0A6C0H4P2_9ZZZZ
MSILFKFVGSSFLLTFGIILLVCGSMMLYSYRRISLLEQSVIEHGKILQSFILNYNIQMQSINSLISKNKFENEETKQIKKINLGDKIYVSEDEYSENEYIVNNVKNTNSSASKANVDDKEDYDEDDDEDEDDVSEANDDDVSEANDEDEANDDDEDDDDEDDEDEANDDDEDDEDEANDDDVSEANDEDEANDEAEDDEITKEEDVKESSLEKLLTLSKIEFEKNLKDLGDFEEIDLNKPYFSNNDDETFIKNLPVNLDTFNIDLNTNSKIINLNTIEIPVQETDVTSGLVDSGVTKKNYSKMKVDDLKTIAVTRNLIDNETAQKMKKADLIKIIQNA